MKVNPTSIQGVLIIEPDVFGDRRGWFSETYNAARYKAAGIDVDFVQDNESFSSKGVVRGLHWQAGEHFQAKLVRVLRGAVMDVVVDIRKGSPTYGQHISEVLSAENHRQLFFPHGCAHGMVALEDDTLFSFKCDRFYCHESERGLLFSDPALGIEWPKLDVPIVIADRDLHYPTLAEIEPYSEISASVK